MVQRGLDLIGQRDRTIAWGVEDSVAWHVQQARHLAPEFPKFFAQLARFEHRIHPHGMIVLEFYASPRRRT